MPSVDCSEGLPAPLRGTLLSRIEGEQHLPLLPATAARVLAACENERTGLEELAELITHDPSLAAHMLRIANSVGYAPRVPILSLQQAINRVGLATVSEVAIAVALKERVFAVPGYQERIAELWLHSALTACFAKEIAQLLRKDQDSAFLCGLLHDVGMPIVLQLVCDLVREGCAPSVPPPQMEAAMQELHPTVGARMAEAWKLGPWIRRVILHHHEPALAKYHPDEIPIVALADALAYWTVACETEAAEFQPDPPLIAALHLHEGGLQSLLGRRERVLATARAWT